MDEAKLKRLIRMVEESDIDELEIDRPLGRIRITKRKAAEPSAVVASPSSLVPAAPPAPEIPVQPVSAAAEPAPSAPDPTLVEIVAPMVGTFFVAPAPGAKPYVTIGDHVGVGQVVCIVEAMKLMNEVQSEVAGRVTRICVENGQAVEYGQALFQIAPA
jgi:acetyl-CoA carboxylase biotin carboxyl carrier protein